MNLYGTLPLLTKKKKKKKKQSDGSSSQTKAAQTEKRRKERMRRGGGMECDPLNHHRKVIRKLAGPGRDGRTDCALPSTILLMKWKGRGECPLTDFFALLTPAALKFPHNLCAGCKSRIHEVLTVLFVGARNLFKVLRLSATDGLEGDGLEQELTLGEGEVQEAEKECRGVKLDVINLLSAFVVPARACCCARISLIARPLTDWI